jgi:thioredoxin-dependent peroxiredoxin
MAKTPQVGEPAPDFELEGTDGPFRLSDHRGERVVLLFYPGDNTPVCTKQFCSYRDRPDEFAALGATVVGISAQDVASHEGFIANKGLTVPLLADVDGGWRSPTARMGGWAPSAR